MPDTASLAPPITDTAIDPATERAFRRYSGGAMAFHWITAALMFITLPVAWATVSFARDDPARIFWLMIHKSLGMTVLAVVVLRIAWRAIAAPPVLAGRLAPWEAWGAKINHILLYAILIVMPVSGYLRSAAGGRPPTWFELFPFPGIPQSKALAQAATAVHATTQWAVYLLILLHLLGTAWHVAIRRDGTLERMLPRQTRA